MAYVFFLTRRYEDAERRLEVIRDPEVFEDAAQLRRQMAACRQDPGSC
jgi:hypothetical protein